MTHVYVSARPQDVVDYCALAGFEPPAFLVVVPRPRKVLSDLDPLQPLAVLGLAKRDVIVVELAAAALA